MIAMDDDDRRFLADVVEVMIPRTDTPGAGDLDVARFVADVVVQTFDPVLARGFLRGLRVARRKGVSPAGGVPALRRAMHGINPDLRLFLSTTRELAIEGFMNSQAILEAEGPYTLEKAWFQGAAPNPAAHSGPAGSLGANRQ
jgi:hypothetical protein